MVSLRQETHQNILDSGGSMGTSLSTEPEVAPTGARMHPQDQMVKMSVSSLASVMNHVDERLKKLERGFNKQADNAEIIGASLSKLALLENTLTALQTLDNLVQTTAHTSRLTSTAVPAILRILNSWTRATTRRWRARRRLPMLPREPPRGRATRPRLGTWPPSAS